MLTAAPTTVTVWVGSSGAQSPAHHDLAFNLYVQLFGKKRFRLLPHSAVTNLCVLGRFHPHARQSRYLDISSGLLVNTTSCSLPNAGNEHQLNHSERVEFIQQMCNTENLAGFEVDLVPGNVLFVPPFWYHEVCIRNEFICQFYIK